MTLIRLGWGADNPAFRQMFTGLFMPGATQEQMDFFNELQRRTTSPECAARYLEVVGDFDVRDLLATSDRADARDARARRSVVPFEAGRAARGTDSRRPVHCLSGPEPSVPGERAGFRAVLRGDQAISLPLIGLFSCRLVSDGG